MDRHDFPNDSAESREEQFYRHIETSAGVARPWAEHMAASVMAALWPRLSPEAAAELEAALTPALRKGLHRLDGRVKAERSQGTEGRPSPGTSAEFFDLITRVLRVPPEQAEPVARNVFAALRSTCVGPALAARVAPLLTEELRAVWLDEALPEPVKVRGVPLEAVRRSHELFLSDVRASGVVAEGSEAAALRVVLGRFLQRISGGEAARLLQEFPAGLRELLRDVAPPLDAPAASFGATELRSEVARALGLAEDEAELVVRTVLAATRLMCTDEQRGHVAHQLPADLRAMWERPGVPPLAPAEDVGDARLHEMEAQVRNALGGEAAFAHRALVEVLGVLAERLSGGEARDLLEELPWTLRRDLAVWRRREALPARPHGPKAVLEQVASRLEVDQARARDVARAVFATVRAHVTLKEARDVSAQLPGELKGLWWSEPATEPVAAARAPERAPGPAAPRAAEAPPRPAAALPPPAPAAAASSPDGVPALPTLPVVLVDWALFSVRAGWAVSSALLDMTLGAAARLATRTVEGFAGPRSQPA